MHKAKQIFLKSLEQSRELNFLFLYLKDNLLVPLSFDDILRYQIVSTVSAFDKFIHDIIRIGMVDIFNGVRAETTKYASEPITIEMYKNLVSATVPPKEAIFEQAIFQRHSKNSYQSPDNVANGLSLIWNEQHKWEKISAAMGSNADLIRTNLKLIVNRRNAIVHEADMNPITGEKTQISADEASGITDFIENCGKNIYNLVSA